MSSQKVLTPEAQGTTLLESSTNLASSYNYKFNWGKSPDQVATLPPIDMEPDRVVPENAFTFKRTPCKVACSLVGGVSGWKTQVPLRPGHWGCSSGRRPRHWRAEASRWRRPEGRRPGRRTPGLARSEPRLPPPPKKAPRAPKPKKSLGHSAPCGAEPWEVNLRFEPLANEILVSGYQRGFQRAVLSL